MKKRNPNTLVSIIPKTSSSFNQDNDKTYFKAFPTSGLGNVLLKDKSHILDWLIDLNDLDNADKSDRKIQYNRNTRKFYLIVPYEDGYGPVNPNKKEKNEPTNDTISLDPGVRKFQTYYSPSGQAGILLPGLKQSLKEVYTKISRNQSLIDGKNKNPFFNNDSKRRLRHKNLCLFEKCRNIRSNNHYECINDLSNNYKNVILPIFKASEMAEKEDAQFRKRKIGRKTVAEMLSLGHFEFRQKCINKLGDRLKLVTEEYTSKTCTNCGELNYDLGSSETFDCSNKSCNITIDRDVNGARNIFLKHHRLV